jgi:multidrug efflux system membrane fusion protein
MNSGATLPVTVFDRANVKELATGSLTTTDNQIDTTTGTFKLRAGFTNDDGALFPNQFVNARLLVDTLTGAVVVPTPAIQLGPNGNFAYVVKDDDTVSVRSVKIGPADAGRTAITSGLAIGEKVVIDGADRLREGAKVVVRNNAAAAAGAAGAGPRPAAASPADSDAAGARRRHRQNQDSGGSPAASPPP